MDAPKILSPLWWLSRFNNANFSVISTLFFSVIYILLNVCRVRFQRDLLISGGIWKGKHIYVFSDTQSHTHTHTKKGEILCFALLKVTVHKWKSSLAKSMCVYSGAGCRPAQWNCSEDFYCDATAASSNSNGPSSEVDEIYKVTANASQV